MSDYEPSDIDLYVRRMALIPKNSAGANRLFAFALSGTGKLSSPARATIERLAEGVEEDVLAPYLAIAVAALHGRNRPDEDELARVYGSSSPGRIRRLLDHPERSNLIAVREDFGGARTIAELGWEGVSAD
jgi:hypothetical protein|tara:strand:+ start:1260 stop:1652 length:393 start_codon:yes stop_codon:yes gene_type:complete